MSAPADQESFSFQAEVVQILDLMIHSLYSNKEIFLRELISNASDAIDRLRLELLTQAESPEAEGPLQIRVSYDAGARTITVADNGIGMSRAEVIEHIGTIAKSGTREFLHALTGDQRADASLICRVRLTRGPESASTSCIASRRSVSSGSTDASHVSRSAGSRSSKPSNSTCKRCQRASLMLRVSASATRARSEARGRSSAPRCRAPRRFPRA